MSNTTKVPESTPTDDQAPVSEEELEQLLGEGDTDSAEDVLSESTDGEVWGDDDDGLTPVPESFDASAQGV
jgi:hypothetical protein